MKTKLKASRSNCPECGKMADVVRILEETKNQVREAGFTGWQCKECGFHTTAELIEIPVALQLL